TNQFTATQSGPVLLPVTLAPTLRVSKIAGCDGAPLKFIQEAKKKDADLWVILPKPLVKDEKCSLKFTYAGDEVIFNAGGGNYFVSARESWYPKIANPGEIFGDRALYRLRFRVPKDFTLVATGNRVRAAEEDKQAVTEWETEVPYTVAGFNYGKYKTKSQQVGNHQVTVYVNPDIGDDMKELKNVLERDPKMAAELGITTGGFNTTGLVDRTLVESSNAVRLFSLYFGA